MVNWKKIGILTASSLMLVAVGATMTACGAPGKVKKETIVYDGTTISWGEVKNADSYIVTINDVPKTTSGTKYTYKAKDAESEVVVSVSACNEKGKEGKAVTRTFTRLETIDEVTFDEAGVMSWENIDGADSYLLAINGESVTVSETTYSDFKTGEKLKIQVRPYTTDGLTFSSWSSEYNKTYLSQVENIKYDGETLKWNAVKPATASGVSYEVYINNEMQNNVGTSLEYDAKRETFNVAIKAVSSNPDVYDSVITPDKEFIYLDPIEDLTVSEGELRWPAVAEATSYDVQVGSNKPINVTDTAFKLTAGVPLTVKVRPVTDGEVYFSTWSVNKTAFVLEAPVLQWFNNASLENGEEARAISWSQVNGSVSGYQVSITNPDGSEAVEAYGVNQRDILHAFDTVGEYKVKVQAVSDNQDVYPSAYSAEMLVERLPAPQLKAQKAIVSDPMNNKEFRVTWDPVNHATGYRIFKNNAVLNGVQIAAYTATISNPIPSEQTGETTQLYMIQTLGQGVESIGNGVQRVRLASIIPTAGNSPETCSFEIKSMAMPTGLTCSGNTMIWTGSAQTYAVRGVGSDTPEGTTVAQFGLYNLSAGAFTPSVCAQGDGEKVLASNYTSSINVERLAYPINVGITSYSADLPCISWDPVTHATSYSMTVNATNSIQDVNSGDAISEEYISEEGVSIGLTAVANEWENNTFYVTSAESPVKSFMKLATPTFNKQLVRDGELVWNAPGNATAVGNVFTYTIYNAQKAAVKTALTSTSIGLDDLGSTVGENVYYVKCIGDPSCINSDYSAQISFTVLETPTLTRAETAYTWNSVISASRYEVVVNGEVVKTVEHIDSPDDPTTYYSYVPNKFVTVDTEYTVQIRAVGDDGYTTVNSAYYTIKQLTARLKAPEFALSYTVDGELSATYNQNGYMVATIPTAIANAKGYEYEIAGATSGEIEELSWKKMSTSTGAFTARVRAIGGTFDENGVYYITSSWCDSKNIVLYGAVQNITKIGSGASGKFSWSYADANMPLKGLTITLYYNDGTNSGALSATGFSLTVNERLNEVSRIEIVINSSYALGDEGNLVNTDSNGNLYIGSQVASDDYPV